MYEYLGKKALYSSMLAAVLVLGGCSSSGGDSSGGGGDAPSSAVSGLGVDGYIAGGYLYADLDTSGGENSGDINTTTDAEGNFTFGETVVPHGTYLYLTGGTDIATGTAFGGVLSASFQGEATVVSPLTTMVVSLMQNEGLTYAAAITRVATAMGITEEEVLADPYTDPDLFIAAQGIVSAATTLGDDFSAAIDALAASDMNITAAAAALVPAVDPADAEAVDAYISALQAQIPADATADDLAAYQLIILEAVSNPTAIPDVDDAVAVANALACVTFDVIKGSNTAENNITTDLVLDSCESGDDNVTFAWSSADTGLLGDDGVVAAPVYVGGAVTMSVTITSDVNSSVSAEKSFALSVPRMDNHAPVAVADTNATDEDTALSFNVLANDTDADGDALTLTAVSNGVSFNADGTVSYTPAVDFNGDFIFSYTVQDSWGDEVNGSVTVTVNALNDAPILDAIGEQTLGEDFVTASIEINASDVDTDSASLSYSVENIANPIIGASFTGNQLTLTSISNLFGDTNVTVMVSDGDKNDTATFVVHVTAVDDAPVIMSINDPQAVDEDSSPIGVGVNASDVDSTFVLDANSSDTSIITVAVVNSNVVITPVADGYGTVTVTVFADDGVNPLTTATFTVTINAVDDAPVLAALSPITVTEDNGTTTVTATATDADNDDGAIVYSMTSSDTNIVTVSGMDLTTVADANGVVEINVTATSNAKTDSQLFAFTVTPVDDAPVLAAISSIVVNEDNGTISIAPSATDIDSNDSLITYELASLNTSVVTVSGSDLVTVANANGVATVEVTARSGALTDTTDFNVTVTAVNDAPTASDFTVSVVTSSTGNTIDLSTYIDDVDGDTLSITAFDATTGLTQTGATIFTYDNDGTEGLITFNYTVEDPDGLTAGGVVTLNVSTEPVIPVANDDTATTDEEVAVNIDVLANDVNVSTISTAWVVTPANGTVQVETNNTITFTPATDKSGLFLVKYTVVSATGHEDNGTVSVTVTDINDAPVINFTTSTPINLTETTAERVVRVDMNITDVDTLLSSVSVDDVSSNSGTITVQGYGTDYVDVLIPAYANGDANITVTANDGEDTTESFSVHVTAVDSAPVVTTTETSIDLTLGVQYYPMQVEPGDETFTLSITDPGDANVATFYMAGLTLEITPAGRGTTVITVHAVNNADNALTSDTNVTINVYDPSNTAPVAAASAFSVVADSVIQTSLNVSDANGDLLTFTIVTPPAHGNVISIDEWGNLVYAAADAYIGADSFTYIANDGDLDSEEATVAIDVTASPDGDSGDSSEIQITLEQYNAYTAQSADGIAMYSVWEEGWGIESNLTTERLIVDATAQEIEISENGTVTELIPYTLEGPGETMSIDFDSNGTIDFEVKYIGTATKEDIETDLNLTLPVGSAGFKLATLQVTEDFDEWDESEYSDWDCSVPDQPCIGLDPYATLDDFVTDTTFDTNNPRMHEMWIDGYNFMFAPDTNLSDGSGTVVRAGHYWDGSSDVWIVTNADAGTWEVVNVDGTDIIKVTPTVYTLETVRTYQENIDGTVHPGEYSSPNSASLEYKYDENTMYHIGNSIMNRTVSLPEQQLVDASSEFISFNTLVTEPLVQDSGMYAIFAYDDYGTYTINLHGLYFDSNGSLYMTDTQDGDVNLTYTLNGDIATIDGIGIDGKVAETITDVAELSAMTGVPQSALPASPVAYRFAHISPDEELDIWDNTVIGLDGSTTYNSYSAFETAFVNAQVALDYTPNGGIGFASGVSGVGGTLAEYSPTLEVITPNAGTWEVITANGQEVLVFEVTVTHNGDHNAITLSGNTGLISDGRYLPPESGSVELRYNAETRDAIVAYLEDQDTTYDNQINFEIETLIMRDVEAVLFTSNKMNDAQVDVNSTTCERNVTTSYVWMDGDSASGSFVMSDDPESYTYVSSDGKVGTVTQTFSGTEVYMVKVSEEVNASVLMSKTSLFLPMTAHGYRITYMDISTGQGGTELRLDDATVGYLESYLHNNPQLDSMCTP